MTEFPTSGETRNIRQIDIPGITYHGKKSLKRGKRRKGPGNSDETFFYFYFPCNFLLPPYLFSFLLYSRRKRKRFFSPKFIPPILVNILLTRRSREFTLFSSPTPTHARTLTHELDITLCAHTRQKEGSRQTEETERADP